MPPADRRPRLQQATRCTPRSATAQAKVACQLISLDEKQFQNALRQKALANGLGDSARVRYPGGKAILAQGQAGALMYVVLEGRVAISLHGEVVERAGPGGVFGEMALVDQSVLRRGPARGNGRAPAPGGRRGQLT